MKKEFYTIDELEKLMEYFLLRLQSIRSLQILINEYQHRNQNSSLLINYNVYFDTLYHCAGNMLVIELCNVFDDKRDTFAINKAANWALHMFEPLCKQVVYSPYVFSASSYTKEEFQTQIGKINKSISVLIEKIKFIRNKEGLGHGMAYNFDIKISYDELDLLCKAAYDYYNLISERFLSKSYAFTKSIFESKSLNNLISEYQKISN